MHDLLTPCISHSAAIINLTCFQITRTENNYWKVEDADLYSSDQFPVFIGYDSSNEEMHYYGLPIEEYPGLLKVGARCSDYITILYTSKIFGRSIINL